MSIWTDCASSWGRWEPLAAYALDRARTPGQQAALGSLMPQLGLARSHRRTLRAISVPTTLIWGRQDLQVRLQVAEAASARHGWPLHVIENAGDDPPFEQPEALPAHAPHRAGHRDRRGGPQMTTTTIDIAGLDGGHVNLTSEQLDDLDSRVERLGCCAPATRAGTTRC